MSLEQNKKDMDEALEELQSRTDELDGILTSGFIDAFNDVISEYGHIADDITELESENERLQDLVDDNELG